MPFCVKKCDYCDFYSTCNLELRDAYVDELCRRLSKLKLTADTLYLGGGTPSLLSGEHIAKIVNRTRQLLTPDCEITVELNPGDRLADLLERIADCGVNRISLGMQSHNNAELTRLTRRHTAKDVDDAINFAHRAGISNISLDVMLGIETQTMSSLRETLEFCINSGATHISAYMLKIEEGTPFAARADELNIPDEDRVADMYLNASRLLTANGFEHYEISNFAKSGKRSRHNMKYWNCDSYIGIGPAAHSFYNGERFYYPRDIVSFINGCEAVSDGAGGDFEEYAMLRLRLSDGLVYNDALARYPSSEERLRELIKKADRLEAPELLICGEDRLALTPKGFLLSNALLAELLHI